LAKILFISGQSGEQAVLSAGGVTSSVGTAEKGTTNTALAQLNGTTGFIQSIDHQKGLVHVQFYNLDTATLDMWVVPVGFLKQPSKIGQRPFLSITSCEQLQNMCSGIALKLANVYARRIILALLEHCNLNGLEGPITVTDVRPTALFCSVLFCSVWALH